MNLDDLWHPAAPPGPTRGAPMPRELRTRYAGGLEIPLHPDRPTVIVNFVSTIDGIVALGTGDQAGGGPISGFNKADRFVMALLRAVSDVLFVGAGTIAGTSSGDWSAAHLEPAHAAAFARWRRSMGLAPSPTAVIVTGSGELRLGRRGLSDSSMPVIVATTSRGARRLGTDLPAHVSVRVVGSGSHLTPDDVAGLLAGLGARVILSEGGPHLHGDLVAADATDELFLTLAPQIVGRAAEGRLGLVEGVGLSAADARWFDLASVKRSSDHLFLRYRRRRDGPDRATGEAP